MFSLNDNLPLYSIFILFLIISASFITELFPCKVRKILNNNIYIKHFFGFLTMLFFVILTTPIKNSDVLIIILKSFLVYIIFIFVTKTNYIFFITIMILLAIIYILILKKYELKDIIDNEKDNDEKNKLTNYLNNFVIINDILFILVIILIIIGFLIYYGEKKYEYKKDFNFIIFLFGKPDCSYKNSNISMINSLKYAVKNN